MHLRKRQKKGVLISENAQSYVLQRKGMAEGEGFEPSVACATSVFKTGALNQTLPPLRVERTLRNKVDFGKQQTLKNYFFNPI